MPTTYYVRATSGSNAFSGLSAAAAKATCAGLLAAVTPVAGDTIDIDETFRTPFNLSALTWSGGGITLRGNGATTWIYVGTEYGNTANGSAWVNTSGNQWSKTIATGLTINGVQKSWMTSLDSNGLHQGHLDAGDPTTTVNTYSYNSGTGAMVINVTSSPNTSSADIVVQTGIAGACAVDINGGTGHIVSDINTGPQPTNDLGYGVRITNASRCTVIRNKIWDPGSHAIGFTLGSVDNQTIQNECYGGWAVSNAIVWHTDTTALSGSTSIRDKVRAYRYKRPDGTAMTTKSGIGGAIDAITQVGLFTHSNGNAVVTPPTSTLLDWWEVEAGLSNQPWSGTSANLVAGAKFYAYRPTIRIANTVDWSDINTILYQPIILIDKALGASRGCFFMNSAGTLTNVVTMHAPQIIANLDNAIGDASDSRLFLTTVGASSTCRFDLYNPSIYINGDSTSATNWRAIFDYNNADRDVYRVYGLLLSWKSATTVNAVCINDSGVTKAHHVLPDSRVFNVGTGRYSQNASFDTAVEWFSVAGPDVLGGVLASQPFPNSPTNLGLTAASPAWALRRLTTSTPVPNTGINGPYSYYYGAYQYPAPTFGREERDMRCCRFSRCLGT